MGQTWPSCRAAEGYGARGIENILSEWWLFQGLETPETWPASHTLSAVSKGVSSGMPDMSPMRQADFAGQAETAGHRRSLTSPERGYVYKEAAAQWGFKVKKLPLPSAELCTYVPRLSELQKVWSTVDPPLMDFTQQLARHLVYWQKCLCLVTRKNKENMQTVSVHAWVDAKSGPENRLINIWYLIIA